MNLQNKHFKLKYALLFGVVLIVVGAASIYFMLRVPEQKSAAVTTKPAVFSFDASKAPGWYRSPLGTGSKEARRSLLIFDHDISKPRSSGDTKSCHLSAFLNQGIVDIDAKRKKIEETNFDNRKPTLVDTLDLTLQKTSESAKYTLYRYDYTGGSEKFKNGNAYGYIQVDEHYVEVQAICDTFEMLNKATDALTAIRYDENTPKDDLF